MIVARRELRLDQGASKWVVLVEISAPELRNGAWICDFSIGWPSRADKSSAAGVDSAQALYFAFQKVAACLYASTYHKAGQLKWEQSDGGYGFVLPLSGRDLAIGSDRKL